MNMDMLKTLMFWQRNFVLRRNIQYKPVGLLPDGTWLQINMSAIQRTKDELDLKRSAQDIAKEIEAFLWKSPSGHTSFVNNESINYKALCRQICHCFSPALPDRLTVELDQKTYASLLITEPEIHDLLFELTSRSPDDFDALLCEPDIWPIPLTISQLCSSKIEFPTLCRILPRIIPSATFAYGRMCARLLHDLATLWHGRPYWGEEWKEGHTLIDKVCHFYEQRIHPWYKRTNTLPLSASVHDFLQLRREVIFAINRWEFAPTDLVTFLHDFLLCAELLGTGAQDKNLPPIVARAAKKYGLNKDFDPYAFLATHLAVYIESHTISLP